jgi:prepilin-type N-terminal cleavage/methylation domain-containing protein
MHNSQNRGFTLIEVLIAAGILACSLVGVAALFSYAIRANTHNRQMAAATALACDKMEELRALPFNSSLWTAGSETIVVNSGRFTRSWQFSPDVPRAVTVDDLCEYRSDEPATNGIDSCHDVNQPGVLNVSSTKQRFLTY